MLTNNTILGVVGLAGAGKTEASQHLVQKTKWPKIHFGDITAQGLKELKLEITEANERTFREEMRAVYGMAAYAILNLAKIKELAATSSVVVESLYSWEEYLILKKEFGESFKVLAVCASPAQRSKRLQARALRPLAPEEFESRDISQIENLHQAGPIARADFTVVNEGERSELFKNIDIIISKLSA